MMNQFYKFIFIVINVWLSSPVLFCSTYSDNMKEAVPFHLDYTSTPFSFNFQLNPDDYIMESSDSCSYKLFKSENENYVIISSNDCSMSNINNLEPATEYSIEFVFGHGRRLSIKRTKLTTESLNYQVIHFGLKAFEYASVHSFFDENQNEMCRLYDSDTEKQLNCGKKDECNCKTDVVTNLEIGKSYNIRIVKINGTNLGHLSVKTMIKPEFDVSSDSNGLNVKYDYKDIITMPKSCKLFIINNDNSSEALNTESIDLLEHTPAVQETDCNSISNIKLEEKSEQTSHHLILTDRFNQQIHSLTIYSQGRVGLNLFYRGLKAFSYIVTNREFVNTDRCYAIDQSTGQELDCSVPNSLGQRCSCIGVVQIVNLNPGQRYDINFFSNNQESLGNIQIIMGNLARVTKTYFGIRRLSYSIDRSDNYGRLTANCIICLLPAEANQEGGCCQRNFHSIGFDAYCTGYEFNFLESGNNYILQGCDSNGEEWLRILAYTASIPTSASISIQDGMYLIDSTYNNELFIPNECLVYSNDFNSIPLNCGQVSQCNCTTGSYIYNNQDPTNSTIIVTDYAHDIIFMGFAYGNIYFTPSNKPTTPIPTEPSPITEPVTPSRIISYGLLGGAVAGVVITIVLVCVGVVYGIYRLSKKISSKETSL